MILDELTIFRQHGRQFIPDITKPVLPGPFKGRPEITLEKVDEEALAALCPTGAISKAPVSIDLGKCVMCGECAFAFPSKIKFTKDYKIATNVRENLIIKEGDLEPVIWMNPKFAERYKPCLADHLSYAKSVPQAPMPMKLNSTPAEMLILIWAVSALNFWRRPDIAMAS